MTPGVLLFILFVLWIGIEIVLAHALAKAGKGLFHFVRECFRRASARNPKYLAPSDDGTKPPQGPANS